MDELDLKTRFVRSWLTYGDPWQAACDTFPSPSHGGERYVAHHEWTVASDVLAIRDAMLEEFGDDAFQPTKAQIGRELLRRARQIEDPAAIVPLMRLYGEHRSFIGNKDAPSSVHVNNVFMIPERVERKEAEVAERQRKLVEFARI